jgi:hypothetical protein
LSGRDNFINESINDYILDRMTVVRIEITVDIFPSADFYYSCNRRGEDLELHRILKKEEERHVEFSWWPIAHFSSSG